VSFSGIQCHQWHGLEIKLVQTCVKKTMDLPDPDPA